MMITNITIKCIGSTPSFLSKLEPTYEQSGKSQGGLAPECYGVSRGREVFLLDCKYSVKEYRFRNKS